MNHDMILAKVFIIMVGVELLVGTAMFILGWILS